jgi:lipoprotein-anchoring transpeptidase ErfK/SrfK
MQSSPPGPRVERRRRRTHVRTAVVVGVILLVAAGAGAVVLSQGGDDLRAAPTPTSTSAATAARTLTGPNVFADLGNQKFHVVSVLDRDIPVYAAPDAGAEPVDTLSRTTEYLLPRTLLGFNSYADWVQVYLPTRPNSSTGWVRTSDVKVDAQPIEWAVKVDLANYRVTVLKNGVVQYQADAAIGSPTYPTPTGIFYITDPIDLRDQPGTGYGAYAFGLSGHSDVLTDFGGGDGQIAIHGTDNPGDVGQAISHGCVRLKNDDIVRLAELPLGTPVFIT